MLKKNIVNYAFAFCNGMTDITLGENVVVIGNYAFDGCDVLANITSKDNILKVGTGAISDTPYFKTTMSSKKSVYLGKCLIKVRPDVIGTDLVIEEGTKAIADYAFEYFQDIVNITIPDSVEYIGNQAFFYCQGVKKLTLGNGIKEVGDGAFESCSGLTSLTLPDGVKEVGIGAFRGCSNLKTVSIGKGIEDIRSNAFTNCSLLTDVYYAGSRGMWRKVSVGVPNDRLENANMQYGIEMPGEIDVEVTQTWYNSVVIESGEIKTNY